MQTGARNLGSSCLPTQCTARRLSCSQLTTWCGIWRAWPLSTETHLTSVWWIIERARWFSRTMMWSWTMVKLLQLWSFLTVGVPIQPSLARSARTYWPSSWKITKKAAASAAHKQSNHRRTRSACTSSTPRTKWAKLRSTWTPTTSCKTITIQPGCTRILSSPTSGLKLAQKLSASESSFGS